MNIADAIYHVAHGYPGGIPALALRMGKSANVLQNKVNPHMDTHHVTAEEAAQIGDLANSDDIARAFAARRNLICVHLASFDGVSDIELLDLLLQQDIERGHWSYAIRQALEDGVIEPAEFERIEQEFNAFCTAGAEVMSRLRSMVQSRKVRAVK